MIEIIDYQPKWAVEFQEAARALRERLGALAVRIDHIGSTAVPGLAAKNILDIQISVAELSDPLLERLTSLGYSRLDGFNCDDRPPGDESPANEWHKWLFRPPAIQRLSNTHVRIIGRANQRYALLFRDYLRAHPDAAAAYGNLKRQLARELKEESRYPSAKGPACHLIYLAAVAWASSSNWQAAPSDA